MATPSSSAGDRALVATVMRTHPYRCATQAWSLGRYVCLTACPPHPSRPDMKGLFVMHETCKALSTHIFYIWVLHVRKYKTEQKRELLCKPMKSILTFCRLMLHSQYEPKCNTTPECCQLDWCWMAVGVLLKHFFCMVMSSWASVPYQFPIVSAPTDFSPPRFILEFQLKSKLKTHFFRLAFNTD